MTRSNGTAARRFASDSAWRRPAALSETSMCWPRCCSGSERSVRPWRVRTTVSTPPSLSTVTARPAGRSRTIAAMPDTMAGYHPRALLLVRAFEKPIRRSSLGGSIAGIVAGSVVMYGAAVDPWPVAAVVTIPVTVGVGLAVTFLFLPTRVRRAFEAFSWLGAREVDRLRERTASPPPASGGGRRGVARGEPRRPHHSRGACRDAAEPRADRRGPHRARRARRPAVRNPGPGPARGRRAPGVRRDPRDRRLRPRGARRGGRVDAARLRPCPGGEGRRGGHGGALPAGPRRAGRPGVRWSPSAPRWVARRRR